MDEKGKERVYKDDGMYCPANQLMECDDQLKEDKDNWDECFSALWDRMSEHAFVWYDVEKEEGNGVTCIPGGWIQVYWCKDVRMEVMGVASRMRVRVCDGDGWKEVYQDRVDCIDLDVDGRRWEGGVKDGKPFGYGVLYDEEGRREYEGFIMNGIRTCHGIEYYSDLNQIKYIGNYCNGVRFGGGVLYDRGGSIDYEGLWKNNKPFSSESNDTSSIIIPKKSFHRPQFFILPHYFHSLKRIVIDYKCFIRVRSFELDGLSELERMEVGKKSFFIPFDRLIPGRFRVVNCPKLLSIRIGHDSFQTFDSFEIDNLSSLRILEIGWRCFTCAPSFSLTGLTD